MELEIKQWLAGDQDYQTGVAIYDRIGTSATLKRMFAGSDNSFCRAKLIKSLQELVETNVPGKPAAEPLPAPTAPVPAPYNTPTEFQKQLRAQMRPLLDKRTELHGMLTMHEQLGLHRENIVQICAQIKKITGQITPLYLQLENGPPAAPAPAAPVDFSQLTGAQLVQARSNLRSLRTKIKKKPDRLQELPAIEAQIEQLTQLIDNPQ